RTSKDHLDLLKDQAPDIIHTRRPNTFEQLVEHGYLQDLTSLIKRDKFDIDNFDKGIIDLLRSKGNGKLYGLAPTFSGRALFYNKSIFAEYNVPYPTDRMSWEEVLQLAS